MLFNRITHAKLRPLEASDVYSDFKQLLQEATFHVKKTARRFGVNLHKVEYVDDEPGEVDYPRFSNGLIVLKGYYVHKGRRRYFYAGFQVENGKVKPLDIVYDEQKQPYEFTREGIKRLLGDWKTSTKGGLTFFRKFEKALLQRDIEKPNEKEGVVVDEETKGKEIVAIVNSKGEREYVPVVCLSKIPTVLKTAQKEEEDIEELPLRVHRVKKFPESTQFPIETKTPESLQQYVDMIDKLLDLQESLKEDARKILQQYEERKESVSEEVVALAKKILGDAEIQDNRIYDIGDKLVLIQRAWISSRIKKRPDAEQVYNLALAELDEELKEKVLRKVEELKKALTVEVGVIGPKIEYKYKAPEIQESKPSAEVVEKKGQFSDLFDVYEEYTEGLLKVRSILDTLFYKVKEQSLPEIPLGKEAQLEWSESSTHAYLKPRRTYAQVQKRISVSQIIEEWNKGNISEKRVLELMK
ncbi:MAG TPA: hypothetical protein P5140_08015 [Methanofastidiosum sp.]|nr:hypothetical protein [Methanofastidiosum sp.]